MTTKKKKSVKTNNISLKTLHGANKVSPYDRMKMALSWRSRSLNEAQYEELCSAYYEWALKPTSTSITAFCNEWGMVRKTFYDLVRKNKELAYMHGVVKEILGDRLQKLAMYKQNECNEKTIHRTLHLYNPDWKDVYDAEVELKKQLSKDEAKSKPTNITVVMDKIEPECADEDKAK